MLDEDVQVGDLVTVRFSAYKFSTLPQALLDIPYDEIGLVIQRKGNVCVVAFTNPSEKIMSFLINQVEVVSGYISEED